MAPAQKFLAFGGFCFMSMVGLGATAAWGQGCTQDWVQGPHTLGVVGEVRALAMWYPNGGPYRELLVVGGAFTQAGGVIAAKIATYDTATHQWSALGNPGGVVTDIVTLPDNTLVISGTLPNGVVKWDGSAWVALGSNSPSAFGNTPAISGLANFDDRVFAVGNFNQLGTDMCFGLAKWDAGVWSCFGFAPGNVFDVTVVEPGVPFTGELYFARRWGTNEFAAQVDGGAQQVQRVWSLDFSRVAIRGSFTSVAGVNATNTALYDGATWQAMTYTQPNVTFTGPVTYGRFNYVAGASGQGVDGYGLADWTGSSWAPLAGGLNGEVRSIARTRNGADLFVAGDFTMQGSNPARHIARYAYGGCTCDSIDFNNDGSLVDPQDIDSFLSLYSEGPCVPNGAVCNDVDFNNDTSVFDPCDIDSFLLVYSEGPCTMCGA